MDRHILSESDLELIGVQIPCGSNISSITNMHVQNITPTYVVGLVVILWKSSSVKIFWINKCSYYFVQEPNSNTSSQSWSVRKTWKFFETKRYTVWIDKNLLSRKERHSFEWGGDKVQKQKQLVLYNLKEACIKLKETSADPAVSFLTFSELKPIWYVQAGP